MFILNSDDGNNISGGDCYCACSSGAELQALTEGYEWHMCGCLCDHHQFNDAGTMQKAQISMP